MKKNKKVYPYRDAEMLLAAKTVVKSFQENIDLLSTYRTNWTPEYAEDLASRIDHAIDNYMEIDRKKDLREATAYLSSIQLPALRDLSAFRTQVAADFRQGAEAILNLLGFNENFNDAKRKGSQEALIRVLAGFKMGMDDALKEKIVSKGMKPGLIDRIISYADNLKEANATQEMLKETSKMVTSEARTVFSEIYKEVIGICKIAYGCYTFDPVLREHFSFAKVVRNMSFLPENDGSAEAA
jgi:hypothetical protein